MTAARPMHAFDVIPGDVQPSLVTLFLRRLLAVLSPARAVWTSARRKPPRMENAAAAGTAPGLVRPGAARRDAELRALRPSAEMDTTEFAALDAKVDAALRRPVNGRYRGTQPRQAPVPWSELRQRFDDRPSRAVLERVLDGLVKL